MSYEKVRQLQSRIIIGTKQTIKAMKNGEVQEVFVAADAEARLTAEVMDLAEGLKIPYVKVDSKEELGKACSIDVDATTVAIKS